MGENRCKKVLILSLGTGTFIDTKVKSDTQEKSKEYLTEAEIDEKVRDAYFNEKQNYRITTYSIDGVECEPVAFVAEPLIRKCKPNKVFIVGTVKSSWSGFYNAFASRENKTYENYKELYNIETEKGRDTGGEELDACNLQIQNIFNSASMFSNIQPEIDVHVLLVRYGIDNGQLLENYRRMALVERILEKNKHYEISFDITHSFRSLPLYNLIILNYLKNITQYDIDIDHVYYGNLEVIRENNYVAPIVDLKELINVLNLTNGVSEFGNTGNLVTLLRQMSDRNYLKKLLDNFDWSTQTNDFDNIVWSLKLLIGYLSKGDRKDNSDSRYADLEEMLFRVLSEELLDNEGSLLLSKTTPENIAEIQYLLCRWYMNQNRYGQAIATALEALRSYLVIMYLKYKGIENTLDNCSNENNRKASLDRLKLIDKNLKDEDTKLLLQLEETREKVKQIRDMFAHNLSASNTYGKTKTSDINICIDAANMEDMLLKDNKEAIEKFIDCLSCLRSRFKTDRKNNLYKVYSYSQNQNQVVKSDKEIRLFISGEYKLDYRSNYMASKTSKKQYDVYLLPEIFSKRIKGETKQNSIANGILLSEYIKRYFTADKIHVIMENNLKYSQLVHYSEILRSNGVSNIEHVGNDGQVTSLAMLELNISYNESKYNETEKTLEILGEKPVRVKA